MNGRSMIMLAVALVCGLGAMLGVRMMVDDKAKEVPMREVLAASRNIQVEETLKPDMVKVIKLPANGLPQGSFTSYKLVADRWAKIPILAGEPIVESKLAEKDAPLGLLGRIPDGMRAFAIEVNEQTGVSGFVLPDHRVDVILSRDARGKGGGGPESETLLQDIFVLAAGQTTSRPDDKSVQVRTVTLAVTPEQVTILTAARTEGTLSLSLRGHNDHTIVEVAKAKLEPEPEPVAEPAPEPAPEPPPPPPPVQVVAAEPPRPTRRIIIHRGGHPPQVIVPGAGAVQLAREDRPAATPAVPAISPSMMPGMLAPFAPNMLVSPPALAAPPEGATSPPPEETADGGRLVRSAASRPGS